MQQTGFEAKEIGVGEFSTMNCFCASHDKALFAPVEDAPLVFSSEQLALLHYRAIAAEFYQRNSQLESAESELDYESNESPNPRFSWIAMCSDQATEESHRGVQFRSAVRPGGRRSLSGSRSAAYELDCNVQIPEVAGEVETLRHDTIARSHSLLGSQPA